MSARPASETAAPRSMADRPKFGLIGGGRGRGGGKCAVEQVAAARHVTKQLALAIVESTARILHGLKQAVLGNVDVAPDAVQKLGLVERTSFDAVSAIRSSSALGRRGISSPSRPSSRPLAGSMTNPSNPTACGGGWSVVRLGEASDMAAISAHLQWFVRTSR